MHHFDTQESIVSFLKSERDSVAIIRDKLFSVVFHDADPYHTEMYMQMVQLVPVFHNGIYYGDAQEFLSTDVTREYKELQTLVLRIVDLLDVYPYPGESIIDFIDRLLRAGVSFIIETEA